MIKGILFDLGWTLEKPETGDWMLTRKFREYVPESVQEKIDPEVWKKAMEKADGPLYSRHLMHTRKEELEVFTDYYYDLINGVPGLSISRKDAEVIAYDRTYDYRKYILFDDTIPVLKQLKEQGYRLGVLSDTWPSTIPQLASLGVDKYFDCFTYSFELGTFKPDPRMYEDALGKIRLPGNEVLFVDDLVKNLHGAAAFGIHCVQSLAKPGAVPDPEFPGVSSPSGVLQLLK